MYLLFLVTIVCVLEHRYYPSRKSAIKVNLPLELQCIASLACTTCMLMMYVIINSSKCLLYKTSISMDTYPNTFKNCFVVFIKLQVMMI